MACAYDCGSLGNKRQNNSILYNILKNHHGTERRALSGLGSVPAQQACYCGSKAKVKLRCPQLTCNAASTVLLKTVKFVKSVPCFRELPADDQMLLVLGSWAQLLVLGMAQDRVDFEITEVPKYSMLQSILTSGHKQDTQQEKSSQGVPLSDIRVIKSFLSRCWSLDVSTKEYAYLKGAALFNPDLVGLRYEHHIHWLQLEAHRALREHVRTVHREESTRFARLFVALALLRSVSSSAVAELFFKPMLGTVDVEQLLLDMLYEKQLETCGR